VGFEPTVRLPVRLISSQVPSTSSATLPSIQNQGGEDIVKHSLVDELVSRAKFRSGNDRIYSSGEYSGSRSIAAGRARLIDLLFLGVAFGRPKVFVVIGEFVHGTPKQPDKAGAQRVEPLRRFVIQRRGAHGAG
jgi:hypothetical protein